MLIDIYRFVCSMFAQTVKRFRRPPPTAGFLAPGSSNRHPGNWQGLIRIYGSLGLGGTWNSRQHRLRKATPYFSKQIGALQINGATSSASRSTPHSLLPLPPSPLHPTSSGTSWSLDLKTRCSQIGKPSSRFKPSEGHIFFGLKPSIGG